MNRIARVASVAAASLALVSPAPIASAAPAPAADVRQPTATFKVVARINRTDVVSGEETVRITGRVRPKAAGQKVLLQQRRDGSKRWVKSGTARIRPTGRFVLKDEPTRPGVRFYRVLKPAADGIRTGMSRELQLDVWGWERLTHRTLGANYGVLVDAFTEFGTESYDDSLVLQTPGRAGYVEYTLGRDCRALRATYALTDDSATGASGFVTVSLDGVGMVTHTLATGTLVEDYYIDVTGAFRLRFDMSATGGPVGRSAVGDPEVLCLP